MKLVTLRWARCVQLGENPECAALGCHCIFYYGEKVYRTDSDYGTKRAKFFCRDCIEKKPFVISLLLRNPRQLYLNATLSLGILPVKCIHAKG